MALEWLLAKVGRRLSETPAEDGLGSFLSIEDVAIVAAGTDHGADTPEDDGGWGGEKLSAIPTALCDATLRANVDTELEVRRGGDYRGGGGGRGEIMTKTLEELSGDPAEAFPWESRGGRGEGSTGGAGRGDRGGGVEGPREDCSASAAAVAAAAGSSGERAAATAEVGEDKVTAPEEEGRQGGARTSASDRGMVFGDAGEFGSEQTTMFEIADERRGDGGSGGGDGGARTGGEAGKSVDVVQVGRKNGRRPGLADGAGGGAGGLGKHQYGVTLTSEFLVTTREILL